ncbi:putative resolvase [Ilumatobacter coccineus YM16-304] [Mycobacterium shimoidei]|uniref:Putative resolvase [Ilumatobacter coccineus YM16-304] n=1 Tax=Mycobacterium shimoidei TaxID=29313 RepID=A0A375Z1U1_MYCSH|nr:recombinase family protein [Mycobacterium shimoidei]SRX95099.1 putative resolvase [Ilumatobacter coccineus YM16-304] [Mycobacterium shimoidei]
MGEPNARALRVIGYVRVSTKDQGKNGHGLGAQTEVLQQFCAQRGYELLTITSDVVSGGAADRMYGRATAIAALEAGIADALLVRALDRATRDQLDGAKLYKRAEQNGWRLMDCEGADSGEANQRLVADVRIAVAAEEKRKVSARTKEGLAKARKAGRLIGRPPQVAPDLAKRIMTMHTRDALSAYAIAKRLTEQGEPTPRGGTRWYQTTVRDVLAREQKREMADAS